MTVSRTFDLTCDFLPNVAAIACCSTRRLYSSRIVALLLTFYLEPCLAVVQALSRTLLYSVFIFWKGEFEFELGQRPMLAAERSDRERW